MSRSCFRLAALLSAALLPALAVRAEMPPDAYEELRKNAPEVLVIDVTHVTSTVRPRNDGPLRYSDIAATVVVRSVVRSAKGVKAGAKLPLRYDTFTVLSPGWVGPGPVPVLQPGRRYRAWLQKTWSRASGVRFVPAARSWSFEPL